MIIFSVLKCFTMMIPCKQLMIVVYGLFELQNSVECFRKPLIT